MVYVGTDIIEIERIRNAVKRHPAFYDRVLSNREKEYYMVKKDPFPFLAGRFAAKEAIIKCLGCGMRGLSWHDMEIFPDEMGAPQVLVNQVMERLFEQKGISTIKVSISHSRDYAVAVAIGE
ncbi:MAG: holo-[acyl-carrier-protein] synthase [Firmicutes bacterium HGW-Firmicutes-12]|nr:MAG: holo-[acyl-carrier-protein] synthase [Firmicutes bacterium HGW-Firmicutes-12]